MDADTAETLAGVVRLLRRAAELLWAAVDAEGAGSPRQVLALGIDLAADEARNLLPDAIAVEGPVPVGDEPAGLLRSAEQLLRRIDTPGAGAALRGIKVQALGRGASGPVARRDCAVASALSCPHRWAAKWIASPSDFTSTGSCCWSIRTSHVLSAVRP